MTKRRKIAVLGAVALLAGLLASAVPAQASGYERTYEITIENLTEGQVFTPAVVATHHASFAAFRKGRPASNGIQQLAENGGAGILAAELDGRRRVADVEISPGPIAPGASETVIVTAPFWARRVSVAAMLICTNDGFASVSRARLPFWTGHERVVYGRAYDAGTELNTEDYADLVPPCDGAGGATASNPDLTENGVVRRHHGIQGGADLAPDIHGWSDPVVKVTITRTG